MAPRFAKILALLAFGCHESRARPPRVAAPKPDVVATASADVVLAPAVDAPDADVREMQRAVDGLGYALYGRVRTVAANVAVAPRGLALALGLCAMGARGETRDEVRRAFGASLDDTRWEAALATLARREAAIDAGDAELATFQRVYASRDLVVRDDYASRSLRHWGAPFVRLDFGGPEGVRAQLNGQASAQTRERVRELVPEGGVRAGVGAVVASALSFKARWQADGMRDEGFHVGGGTALVPVAMAHATGRFLYARAPGVQALRLPLGEGERFTLDAFVPDAVAGLAELEAGLTTETVRAWTAALRPTEIDLVMPRFRVAPARSLALRAVLDEAGVGRLFDPTRADLSGIANSPPGEPPFFVSELYHAAVVEVDAEAARPDAATPQTTGGRGVSLRVDRPFVFVISDARAGATWVIGRVNDPTGREG
jgi:serpin B